MKHAKGFLVCVSFLFFLMVLLSPAFGQGRPTDPVKIPPVKRGVSTIPSISTSASYQAVIIAEGVNQPRGIGAYPDRWRVLFNSEGDKSLWYFDLGTLKQVWSGILFQGSRYHGGFYTGDSYGNIYHVLDGPVLEKLATIASAGAITGLDVDRQNGNIYVVDNDSNLYVLRKGQSSAVLVTNVGFASWGVAVRGDYLYISDLDGNQLWRMPKKGGALKVYATGFNGPTDIVSDATGNLYVANFWGGTVAFLPAYTTKIKTIAGGMSEPYYLGVDSKGDVYVSDLDTGIVWMLKKK